MSFSLTPRGLHRTPQSPLATKITVDLVLSPLSVSPPSPPLPPSLDPS